MEIFFALLLFVVVIAVITVIYYNKIIKLKVQVNEGWSDINVQLKRRHNLIGNLVETVKGYATHEKSTLEKVVQARTAAKDTEGKDLATVQNAEKQLDIALKGLNINALAESYPDLKANQNFLQLQAELSDTENKIAASRRFYNSTVSNLNTTIQQFPGNLFAGMAKATKTEFFEIEEDEAVKEVPKVDFHKDTEEAKKDVSAESAPEEKAEETPAPTPAADTEPAESAAPPAEEKEKEEEAPAPAPPAPTTPPTEEKKEEPKEEPKPEEPKTEEAKPEEAKPEEAKPEEAKPEEPKA